jgi:hypothetical protein
MTETSIDNASKLFNCIKSIESGSNKISTWSLSILGGSLLAILSDSYLHPSKTQLKLVYLLFILGWTSIGISIFNGKEIIGRTIASELYKNDENQLVSIFTKCNNCYQRQLRYFNIGLFTFGIWLLLYLIWWIFGETLVNINCK